MSKIRKGCLVKCFETRYTVLGLLDRIVIVKRHCDGFEVELWRDEIVHALACPCKRISQPTSAARKGLKLEIVHG